MSSATGLEEYLETSNGLEDKLNEHHHVVVDNDNAQTVDTSAQITPNAARETGKRAHRDETQSEEDRIEQEADKPEVKRTRTRLREAHERRRPRRFDDFVMNATTSRILDGNGKPICACEVKVPKNRREALRSKWASFWLEAEAEEIAALKAKGFIQEIPNEEIPEDAKPVSTMWVYALKSDHQGYVIRFKARIVALGNHQRPGIDFKETFAPVARMASFRLLLGLAALLELEVYGGDVNTAYLNAWLGIRQYLHSISGYPCRLSGHSYVVLKALYGLRQSGREWNSELNDWFIQRGYQRSLTEPCLYYLFEDDTIVYVLVYVDDILVATNSKQFKDQLFMDLDNTYGLKDQGLLTQYLGVEVTHTPEYIMVNQGKYAREILGKLGFENAHAVGNPMEVNSRLIPLGEKESADSSFPYREAIGMLMYLATSTRPDLAFALGQLSRFVANPSSKHIGTLKRVLRYLAGTLDYGIKYEKKKNNSKELVLQGYCDSDWANDPDQRKSTTGFVFTLAGEAVAWMSRRQSVIALPTAEADYIAACEATMEAVAGKNILQELLPQHKVKLCVGIDNQAAHVMATNPTYSRRTRHIELRWHYVREQVQKGTVELHKVKGETNPADTFTKPLDKKRLKVLLQLAGIEEAK
ncbi:Integrase catalytic core protein [Phytophthora palmivora]|uniref:Integrase catalytic core protein n=1 Tax=Phytophthora palmivora TaxID=4796 RepID=A0A2P4YHE2_9STRA|nr:Integrase catalytic core protein [Phytophthora palmivora]